MVRDDVKCQCVSGFGPNPECGCCGGDGTIEAEVGPVGFCVDCQKEVSLDCYNNKVKPPLMTCKECGQFVYQWTK